MTDHHRPTGPGMLSPAVYPTTGLRRYDPTQTSPLEIWEWFADSCPEGTELSREAGATVSLLPLGVIAAVRMNARLVHAAAGTSDPAALRGRLAQELSGPVIHHPYSAGHPYYALTPCRQAEWPLPDHAAYLAAGTWLGLPDLDRRGPSGVHWVVPPRYRGDLCRLDHVGEFILQGLRAQAEVAAEGEDR
ncbi:hypothetical protein [Streptomyces sp. ST1015]|uniref:hypothetical protein n=1 Tax=Streptomyces sp. ST1015 TaxID=1848900 RepID=UPI000DD77492|nr:MULTISPECIES: hypothetical protein [unclassified Streptomyces]QZZ26500.1 hypothetical protein A7X85_09760 [Streptomyces sp. ST1015]